MARWDHHLGKNFIDGQYVDGGEGWTDVNPASGELIAQQALASPMDVDKAVAAARQLIESRELIALRPLNGGMAWAMGQYLLDHCDSIAQLLSRESGKLIGSSNRNRGQCSLFRVLRKPGRNDGRPLHSLGRCLRRFYRT